MAIEKSYPELLKLGREARIALTEMLRIAHDVILSQKAEIAGLHLTCKSRSDTIIEYSNKIAELQKERDALKIPILQIVAEKLVLLQEPNVLTGAYRMQLRDGYWAVWEPIESLKEQSCITNQ
jgi:hypothetical protein